MPHKSVKLVKNSDGQIVTIPHPVEASRGDTLSWRSNEGDIRVSFHPEDHPFDAPKAPELFAPKRSDTAVVTIRHDVMTGQHFDCVVSVNEGVPTAVYGIDIQP